MKTLSNDPVLEIDPQIAASPGAANVAAIRIAQSFGSGELTRVQTRAEKWIAGLTALAGLIASAMIIKGRDSFAKLDPSYHVLGLEGGPAPVWWIAGCIGSAYVAYAVGIVCGYTAAFGNPFTRDDLGELTARVQLDPDNAALTLRNEVSNRAKGRRKYLTAAVISTIVGMLAVAASLVLAWVIPEKSPPSDSVCVKVGDASIEFDGTLPPVKSGELTVVSC